jgi:hypothetical protein
MPRASIGGAEVKSTKWAPQTSRIVNAAALARALESEQDPNEPYA